MKAEVKTQIPVVDYSNLEEFDSLEANATVTGWPGMTDRVVICEEGKPIGWIPVQKLGFFTADQLFRSFLGGMI
jgi:hypothetical protein